MPYPARPVGTSGRAGWDLRDNGPDMGYRMTLKFVGWMLAASLPLAAMDARAWDESPGAWTVVTLTDTFDQGGEPSRWHYWVDAQARYFDLGSGINQWLVRPAIGYRLDNGMRVWLGYARFRTRGASGTVVNENRLWQQLDWTVGEWLGGRVTMRARLLERTVDVGDDTGLRLRYLTRYVRPFDNGSKNFIVGIEPFFDLNQPDWGGKRGLAQNRVVVGIGWRANNHLAIETGYMNQILVRDDAPDIMNHLGVINFRLSF